MPEPITRTDWLYAELPDKPVTTHDAEQLLAASPFSCHRNSARRSLRTLTRAGLLVCKKDAAGRRKYTRKNPRSVAR
ncbi:hypothetical protein [Streptomyces sp. NPDC096153]|uniref:hypothetical protein n=1 Tax=Streptomyces sp. NPDC096153 TaxID=3155548 RepID=UPI0033282706